MAKWSAKGWGLLCLVGAAVVVAATMAHRRDLPSVPAGPLVESLTCLNPDVDLGDIWQTDRLEVEFRLANRDPQEAFEIKLRGNCRCIKIEPAALSLAPGQEATVKAIIDLERAFAAPLSEPAELREQVMAAASGGSGDTLLVPMTVRGTIRPSYAINPSSLSFGRIVTGEVLAKSVEIKCFQAERADQLKVISVPEGFRATVELSGAEKDAFRLTLHAEPDVPYGPVRGAIRFQALSGRKPFATRSLKVTGLVTDSLHALPRSITVGAIHLGEEHSTVVALQSERAEEFWVEHVQVNSDTIAVRRTGSALENALTYAIVFKASAEGAFEHEVTFYLRTAKGRDFALKVPVRGFVI